MKVKFRRIMFGRSMALSVRALAGILLLIAAGSAIAADHRVSSDMQTLDCAKASPGDTITLEAGPRGPLTVRNCNGNSSKPIVVRNDPNGSSLTTIRTASGSAGGFVFSCVDCVGVMIDGTNKWVGAPAGRTYGIKLTMSGGGSPSAFLKLAGLSRAMTIRGIEIDGAWPALADNGIGISLNDHDKKMASSPGVFYENFLIEKNYIHNVQGEGMYIGPNWYTGGLPLRNIEIRDNVVEDTGWDGIQLKSPIAGTNLIHHNVLRRVGTATSGKTKGEIFGISLLDGTGKIYNNYVQQSGDTGIQHWIPDLPASYGPQEVEIFNNVVVNAGVSDAGGSQGISSGNAGTNRAGQKTADTLPKIYHNTIVRPRGWGIAVGSVSAGGALVQDNIIADAEQGPIKAPAGVNEFNNRAGVVSDMAFVDASGFDFRLRATSPARNAGSERFPSVDFDGVLRPIDGRADQGAFEYHAEGVSPTKPAAPVNFTVD